MANRGMIQVACTMVGVVLGAGLGGASSFDELTGLKEEPVQVAALAPGVLALPVKAARPAPAPKPAAKPAPRPRVDGNAGRWRAWTEVGTKTVMSPSEASLRAFIDRAWVESRR